MKIGIIFGCFDLFHVGHLNVLKQAAIYCDRLIIGVFSDKVVKGYKGVLPVIPEDQRLKIIQHINLGPSCITHVAIIQQRIPHEIPDADYLFVSRKLLGKPLAMIDETFKGKVIHLHYTEGISTSAIKDGIRLSWRLKGE